MKCVNCNKEFESQRSDKKTCSPRCRVAVARSLKGLPDSRAVEPVALEESHCIPVLPDGADIEPEYIHVEELVSDKPKGKKISVSVSKPLMNNMVEPPEPRLHSGWYFRTDLYRKGVIDAIRKDSSLGSIEVHPEYGIVISRSKEQIDRYNAALDVSRWNGDWVAKYKGKWHTHKEFWAMGIKREDLNNLIERLPLYSN